MMRRRAGFEVVAAAAILVSALKQANRPLPRWRIAGNHLEPATMAARLSADYLPLVQVSAPPAHAIGATRTQPRLCLTSGRGRARRRCSMMRG